MLIITRKPGESLIIRTPFGSIRIKSLARDRLGIDAPSGIPVLREELIDDEVAAVTSRKRSKRA